MDWIIFFMKLFTFHSLIMVPLNNKNTPPNNKIKSRMDDQKYGKAVGWVSQPKSQEDKTHSQSEY